MQLAEGCRPCEVLWCFESPVHKQQLGWGCRGWCGADQVRDSTARGVWAAHRRALVVSASLPLGSSDTCQQLVKHLQLLALKQPSRAFQAPHLQCSVWCKGCHYQKR